MSGLPVDVLEKEFKKSLEECPVVVEAPPGSGKSTRLPVWCSRFGRVLVVEPRRIACRSLAGYVAEINGLKLGDKVGYAVRFEGKYEKDTRIVFATPGIALRWYAADALSGFDTVVLDEFHERRWDMDLLAAMLRTGDKHLVLTSATVEGERLARFLGGRRLLAGGKLYDVDIRYAESPTLPSSKNLDRRAADAALSALKKAAGGDVLVFLPGKGEIAAVQAVLEKRLKETEIIPLHASVDIRTQDKALRAEDDPRVILATNVAETSLTLPGVRAVVDSGLERRTHYRNGRTVLALSVIAGSAADQRAGRAGRLGPGICFRLWSESARLEQYTPPEVVREDPSEFILAAAACGFRARELSCPDPVPEHALEKAAHRLQALGALDEKEDITAHGRRLFPLPLDTQLAHLIAAQSDESARADMIDLAAALSAQGRILAPAQSEQGMQDLKRFSPEACDACTLIRLVRGKPPGSVRVNGSALSEAGRIAGQIREVLGVCAPDLSRSPARDALAAGILRADPELCFVRRIKRNWSMGNGSEEVEIGKGTRMPEEKEAAIVLDRHSIPGKGTTRTVTIAACLMPVTFREIARAGLGEVIRREPRLKDSSVTVTAERVYAGRVIDSWEENPRGEALRRAVAGLLLSGRLWPEHGRALVEDIRAWNLYLALGFAAGEPVQAEPWLVSRLEDIGLEDPEDFEILDAEDIRFEGIPEWERPDFDRRYPRGLHLGDLQVDVEYEPDKRRITLVRLAGMRKKSPQRWELPGWGGNWEIRYRDGNRVVPVR